MEDNYVPREHRADLISPTHAAHVLIVLDASGPGPEPGGFVTALIETLTKADSENLKRAALAWPGYAMAVGTYKNDLDGVRWLRLRASNQEPAT